MENKTSGNLKNTIIAFLFLLVTTVIFGCDDSSSNPSSQDSSEKTKKTETTQSETKTAAADASGSATIGSKGGKVKAGKSVTIKIPEDALKNDTKISVKYFEKAPDKSPSFSFLGEVEFGPSGTKFKKPVEVTMKLNHTPNNSTISIFNYDEKNEIWDYVTDAAVTNDTVKFKVDHFSKYRCVDISPEVLNKYFDIVKAAKKNKTSDKQITQSYADYLKNDVKVMDSYVEQNGHLYKACGFRIDGAYYINGEEGDPNELSKKFGKSNKKGNTYGLSKIGSLLYSYADYIKKAKGEKESQDCISIGVIIDYEPVEAYKISGHIEEKFEAEFTRSTAMSIGSFKINVGYDFKGFYQDFETLHIEYTNADVSFSKENLIGVESFDFFKEPISKKQNVKYEIQAGIGTGTFEGICTYFVEHSSGNPLVSIRGLTHYTLPKESKLPKKEWDYNSEIEYRINGDQPLLCFELKEGTKNYTSTDEYRFFNWGIEFNLIATEEEIESRDHPTRDLTLRDFEVLKQTVSTKQTITIEHITEE